MSNDGRSRPAPLSSEEPLEVLDQVSEGGVARIPLDARRELTRRTFGWCRGPESNWLRPPFQGGALPLSYPGT
jgi:hypothetical protein